MGGNIGNLTPSRGGIRHGTNSPGTMRFRHGDVVSVICAASPSWVRLRRLMEGLWGISIGLMMGISLIVVLVLLSIWLPMSLRRRDFPVASSTSTPIPESGPVSSTDADEGEEQLPPISWDLVLSPEQQANRLALREDISSMDADSASGFFTWRVLPYLIEPRDGSDRYAAFENLVDGVYDEEPELSVYTNGSCSGVTLDFAKYHLMDSETDSIEKNKQEYATVTEAADRIHAETEAELEEMRRSGSIPEGCSDDMAYAILLYRRLSSMSDYSDDVNDTEHANDIYGALIEGESKCYGVACAAKAILGRRGIPSFMAYGSVGGDDERRHAWVVTWLDGEWRVMDITYGQLWEMPQHPDLATAMEAKGRWYGCLTPYDAYVRQSHMVTDEECENLMRAYEHRIGVSAS